jgi:hypothetical protein
MSKQYAEYGIDTADPYVAHWALECGIVEAPVRFRLVAKSQNDLQVQIERLTKAFGELVRISAQEHNRVGGEHIAYGAFLA